MPEQPEDRKGKQAAVATTAADLLQISRALAIAEIERFYLASKPLPFQTHSQQASSRPTNEIEVTKCREQ
jgi:hypothetical protein